MIITKASNTLPYLYKGCPAFLGLKVALTQASDMASIATAALGACAPVSSLRSRTPAASRSSRASLAARGSAPRPFQLAALKATNRRRAASSKRLQCRAEAPGAEEEAPASGLVKKLTGEELEVAIQERDRPLIVDFYATWCGPCVLMAKELENVLQELGEDKVRIVKVDTDENPEISNQLQIQGLPTLIFVGMDPNKPALRTEGLLPAATIKQIIADEL